MISLRKLAFVLAYLISGGAAADPYGFQPVQDWPLGTCAGQNLGARLCLGAPRIWADYGHGAPEIGVAVVETWETAAIGQVLDQHPWLSHLDIPIFWHVQEDEELTRVPLQLLPGVRDINQSQPTLVSFCASHPTNPACDALDELASVEIEAALGYFSWAEQSAAHELKMIGLISGQDATTMRRTGLAPLSSISLHFVETTPAGDTLRRLAERLDRLGGIRVVNFSNQGPPDEMLDLQFARSYRTALAVNAGHSAETGRDPSDRLFVASSANTTGYRVVQRSLPSPHRLVPPEARVDLGDAARDIRRSHPRIALAFPRPDVPVLIVGGITSEGQLYGKTRLEPMIDLYAPGGMTIEQETRARGGSSTTSRAEAAYDAVRAMQSCRAVDGAAQILAVPTLGWGAIDHVRSSHLALRANLAWDRAGYVGGAPTLGCETAQQATRQGVFVSRDVGNSVSTAIVSAVAAQMFQLDPQLSARDAQRILRRTAQANRINGLPVLDTQAALRAVAEGFAQRYLDGLRLGDGGASVPRPIPVMGSGANRAIGNGQAMLLARSLSTQSIAPGVFGQAVWRDMADDPPLRFDFETEITSASGSCRRYRIGLETDVRHISGHSHRVIRTEAIVALTQPCFKDISRGLIR